MGLHTTVLRSVEVVPVLSFKPLEAGGTGLERDAAARREGGRAGCAGRQGS